MALSHEEVVDVDHLAAMFNPQLTKVTAVFAFAILDGLQENFLFQNNAT